MEEFKMAIEIIENKNKVLSAHIANQLDKIKRNGVNSLIKFNYWFLHHNNIAIDFNSTSRGTNRQVAGAIVGNLSSTLGKGFKLR